MSDTPKIVLVWLYHDSAKPNVFLDEGQDYKKIVADFKRQDEEMCNESDPDGSAHQKWQPFSKFMKSKGCVELKSKQYFAY